ncbi:hypothetical protein B0H16DRAFT_1729018 [Mycena metata]|uniref:NGN domain-containing protein n=1 Tax=Mycena metata TaxID=1033252 RepID=A0AAD7ID01_9AGAR|nr:hypothetical protein B0H16DRAFT_1729018 [Mycena metata]
MDAIRDWEESGARGRPALSSRSPTPGIRSSSKTPSPYRPSRTFHGGIAAARQNTTVFTNSRASSMAATPAPRARTPLFLPSDSRASSLLATPPPETTLHLEEDEEAMEMARRIPKNVAQFFDLSAIKDAAGDGEEEPETAADRAFIDDSAIDEEDAGVSEPHALHQPLPPIDDSGDESDDAQELAAALQERAETRGYRGAGALRFRNGENTLPENVPERMGQFLVEDLVNLPTVADAELYRVTMEPGREWSFLQWIATSLIPLDATASKILSAFSRPAEAGVVYIETTSRATLDWALRNQRMVRIQALVPVNERASLLWEPLGYRRGWGRIRKGRVYRGDLVLLCDPTDKTALWRQRDFKTKRFRLFRPAAHRNEVDWQEDGMSVERFSQKNVNPTDEEMEGFRHVVDHRVDFADRAPDALAVAPGDRVVVMEDFVRIRSEKYPEWNDCRAGWVVTTRMIESEWFAAVCRNYGHNSTQATVPRGSMFYIPVRYLEHHILRVPRTVELHDRVVVVDGEHTGEMGRVVGPLSGPTENENPPPITVNRCQVALAFMRGDYVEITRGPYRKHSGFIVQLGHCGVPIFESFETRGIAGDGDDDLLRENPKWTDRDYSNIIVVPSNHLKWLDPNGSPLPTASEPITIIQAADRLMTQLDRDVRDRLAKMIYTGKGFAGREVSIKGQHEGYKNDYKGRHGTVVGWHVAKRVNKNSKDWKPDFKVAQEMLIREGPFSWLDTAQVQIRLDGQINIVTVPMTSVFHRESRLPLVQALPIWWTKSVQNRPQTPPLEPDTDVVMDAPLWTQTGPEPTLTIAETIARDCERAELNGSWLANAALINKRIDVRVDVKSVAQRWLSTWSKRAWKADGQVGYIVIVKDDNVENRMLHVRLGATGGEGEAACVKPATGKNDSIATQDVRVIIVGPDFSGSREHIGKYALVVPNATHPHGDNLQVKMEGWLSTPGYFPLCSLCRSLNVQPAGAPIDPVLRLDGRNVGHAKHLHDDALSSSGWAPASLGVNTRQGARDVGHAWEVSNDALSSLGSANAILGVNTRRGDLAHLQTSDTRMRILGGAVLNSDLRDVGHAEELPNDALSSLGSANANLGHAQGVAHRALESLGSASAKLAVNTRRGAHGLKLTRHLARPGRRQQHPGEFGLGERETRRQCSAGRSSSGTRDDLDLNSRHVWHAQDVAHRTLESLASASANLGANARRGAHGLQSTRHLARPGGRSPRPSPIWARRARNSRSIFGGALLDLNPRDVGHT